jgi:hypothetical protein
MRYVIDIDKVDEEQFNVKISEKETGEVMKFEVNRDNLKSRITEILENRFDHFVL